MPLWAVLRVPYRGRTAQGNAARLRRISSGWLPWHGFTPGAYSYAWDNYCSKYPGSSDTADVKLGFDLDMAGLDYRYWLGSGKTGLGLGAGIGYYRIALKTQVAGMSNGELSGAGFA